MTEGDQLRWYLETSATMMAKCNEANGLKGLKWPGLPAFVHEYGKPMEHRVYSTELWGPMLEDKECFANAFRLSCSYPSQLVYCEGYGASIIPCLHAWCVEKETGFVVDPTWKEGSSGEPVLSASYYGIPMNRVWLARVMIEKGVYGVLDSAEWEILTKSPGYHIEDMIEEYSK